MQNKFYGIFSSSEDPTQISLTASSFIKGAGTFLITLAGLNVIPMVITTDQVQQVVDTVTACIGAGFTLYHGVQLVYGIFRKALNAFYAPKATN